MPVSILFQLYRGNPLKPCGRIVSHDM